MLFNSPEFLFAFLPIVLGAYVVLHRLGLARFKYLWLSIASLVFYAWWKPEYSWILIASIIFNYFVGDYLVTSGSRGRLFMLGAGLTTNLLAIGYYKYSVFFVSSIGQAFGLDVNLQSILLPLGISFFTFQQVTYLVDAYYGKVGRYSFIHYFTFVSFFPQLIAGPIVHHSELMPQFKNLDGRWSSVTSDVAVGLSIFTIGLFKKVMIADGLAEIASPVFNQASGGGNVSFFEAWFAALGYTFQLYFDFSGYSDMAIGLSRMFGVALPLNFNSPYKASNIIDFWRRWHVTLSRFLRDYVYIPLGGNKKGAVSKYLNIIITMLIGGIWHGAGWTFILWGALQGVLLAVNHLWRQFGPQKRSCGPLTIVVCWMLTFISVVIGWVFFRADSVASAFVMLKGMAGLGGLTLSEPFAFLARLFPFVSDVTITRSGASIFASNIVMIGSGFLLAVFGKNIMEIFEGRKPVLESQSENQAARKWWKWRPNPIWAVSVAVLFFVCMRKMLSSDSSEFLYFNF